MPPTSSADVPASRARSPKRRHRWLLLSVGAVLFAEMLVRGLGFIDFPVYEANAQVGYIQAGSQHGSFLNRNQWEFNSLHMSAPEFTPTPNPARDILLVGDSVVLGGNAYQQQDRLGPALQASAQHYARGGVVWPVAAGSWALRNELAWLRENPQVPAQVDQVVFVLNTGDFGEASSWSCEATHPRKRPAVALWYLFNKYVYAFEACGQVPPNLQVPPGDLAAELRSFLAVYGDKSLFVLYPDRAETENPALARANFAAGLALLTSSGAQKIVPLAGNERWRTDFYKDDIHPTPEGNRVLADILVGSTELK